MNCPFSNSNKNLLLLAFLALLALILGIGFHAGYTKQHKVSASLAVGTAFDQPRPIPSFHLIDGNGHAFTNRSLKNHFSFLFFGYTHCQGICPMTMTMLTQLYSQFEKDKLPLPEIIFITLDPKRDTQKIVDIYAKAFNPEFKGITGPLANIQQLSKQMGVVYLQAEQTESRNEDYQIDHSGTLYLINPAGQLAALFSPPHEKDNIAKDYENLARQ